jgi:hypothetical protein
VQDGNYSDVNRETGKRATIAELLKFGADELKLDYIFWCTARALLHERIDPFHARYQARLKANRLFNRQHSRFQIPDSRFGRIIPANLSRP